MSGVPGPTPRPRVLGLPFDNVSLDEAVAEIRRRLDRGLRTRALFVNAHCANVAARDTAYRDVIETADLVFADGSGMRLAGRLLGAPVRDNVNGTDLFPLLCAALADGAHPLYLLGAQPGVADEVRQWLAREHPGVVVAGVRDGYFDPADEAAVIADIRGSGAHLLLVAMGVPAQDLFVARHLDATGVIVAMGVGGLFDFFAGRVPRAPAWLRARGMEWSWRLAQEPRRLWRRYLVGNWTFLGRALAARAAHGRQPPRGAP